jgi:hypothetical protein
MNRRLNLMLVTVVMFTILVVIGAICIGGGASDTRQNLNNNTDIVNTLIDKTK